MNFMRLFKEEVLLIRPLYKEILGFPSLWILEYAQTLVMDIIRVYRKTLGLLIL